MGARIIPFIGLKLSDGTIEWLRKGTYWIEQPSSYGETIALNCEDSMGKFDATYSEVTTAYPATAGLTTSQNVTAPKPPPKRKGTRLGLTTSQNVTAPKLLKTHNNITVSLTTSQNVTAPKLNINIYFASNRLTTSQNVTAPKP